MKLRDFLKLFEGMDPELPVCLADWADSGETPSEWPATEVQVVHGTYRTDDPENAERYVEERGRFVQIGGY